MSELRPIEQILDLARWAPSGDNTQPWRYEILSDTQVIVHGFDTREHCVYDLNGRASQLAIGGMLETVRIAASGLRFRAEVERIATPETRPTFRVTLVEDRSVTPSPLIPCVRVRSVQRRALKTRALTPIQKQALETSVGADYRVVWLHSWSQRFAMARLLFENARIRLTIREAFNVHRHVIHWGARFSADKVPDRAVGLDPLTTRLMRWAMQDWRRVEFLNTYLAGTVLPRLQLDFVPSLACAAHFLIVSRTAVATMDDYVAGGAAMQRFWLSATRLGLQLQPEMTPLIFSVYAEERRVFSADEAAVGHARRIAVRFAELFGDRAASDGVFLGRIGMGKPASARSLRLELAQLLTGDEITTSST